MHETVDGLTGIGNIAEDILIYELGDTPAEAEANHDSKFIALLERAKAHTLKLNPTKIQFKLKQVKFIGHHFTEDGVLPYSPKVEVILQCLQPQAIIAAFSGHAKLTQHVFPQSVKGCPPSPDVDLSEYSFQWSSIHLLAFETGKELIAEAPRLMFFDYRKPVTLQVDVSDYGLGGALLQEDVPGRL